MPVGNSDTGIIKEFTRDEMAMLSPSETVFAGELESSTSTVKCKLPETVGVPAIIPFADSVNPVGIGAVKVLQEYGAVPPVADKANVYGVCVTPCGRTKLEIAKGAAFVGLILFTETKAEQLLVAIAERIKNDWRITENLPRR